ITNRSLIGVIPGDVGSVSLTGGAATFADEDVAVSGAVPTSKTVTAPGFTCGGAKSGNYDFPPSTTITSSAIINPKPLIAVFTVANKVYDGTTTATITDRQLVGAVAGEDGQSKLNFTGGLADFTDKNVGPTKSVTISGTLTLGGTNATGPNANNDMIGKKKANTAAITFRTATIVFTVSDKVYDGTNVATISSASIPPATGANLLNGLIAGDNVTVDYSGATATFDLVDAGSNKAVTVSGFILTGPDGPAPGGNGNYQVNVLTVFNATTTATISQKPITIT